MRVITARSIRSMRRSALKINFASSPLKRDPRALHALIQYLVEVVQLNMLHQRRILFTQILDRPAAYAVTLWYRSGRAWEPSPLHRICSRSADLRRDGHFTDHTQPVNLRV